METLEMKLYRSFQRAQAVLVKGHRCDLCRDMATDTHEIVTRKATMGNETARRLSFQKELTAQLCRRCHEGAQNAHTAHTLLLRNCKLYGYEQVQAALNELETAMKSKLDIAFPSKEELVDG